MKFQMNSRKKMLVFTALVVNSILVVFAGCGASTNRPAVKQTLGTKYTAVSCPSTIPTNSLAGYWPLDTQSFQGIYQFTGQAIRKNASNPSISGADLEWSWAKIETAEGQYNWTKVDQDINTWTSTGKSVILRFATGGQVNWSGTVDGSYTPPWVFDTYSVPRVTEINGTVLPEYWNPVFLQKLADFVTAAAARYDHNPGVVAVEIGVGEGGETEPDGNASRNPNLAALWGSHGYTDALWWQTIQKIVGIYKAAWQHTPLALMTTSTFLQRTDKAYTRALVEKYAVQHGLLLQVNALDDRMSSSYFHGMNRYTTTIDEQRQSALSSGYPAIHDVKHAIKLGARYVLVFAADLANPANADALAYAQQQITTPLMPDCSGRNLTLSVQGRVTPVPGESGKSDDYAQFFDGETGTAFASQAPLPGSASWTLEAWMYPTMLPQTEAIAVMNGADTGGFGFGIAGGAQGGTGSQLVAYFPGIGWIDSGYSFTLLRQWYHVVVTRDGSTARFYVNGTLTPGTGSLNPGAVVPHFSVGSSFSTSTGAASHFFTGAIDNVAVYASTLSPAR